MKKQLIYFFVSITFSFAQQFPVTKKIPVKNKIGGIEYIDNYEWLEKDDTESRSWANAQTEVANIKLEEIEKKYDLKNKIKEYYSLSSNSLPTKKGLYFYSLYRKDKNNPAILYYRKKLNDSPIEIFNPVKTENDNSTIITSYYPSKYSKILAVMLSKNGEDLRKLKFYDFESSKILNDELKNIKFSKIFWKGSEGVFYKKNSNKVVTQRDSTFQIFYHKLGENQENDKMIYDSKSNKSRLDFLKSDNKLIITEKDNLNTIYKILDLDNEQNEFTTIIDTTAMDFRFINNNKFYYSSRDFDWGELRYFDINDRANEKVLIPQIYNHLLTDCDFASEYILCSYRTAQKNYLGVYKQNGEFVRKFDAPTGFDFSIQFFDEETKDIYVTFYSKTISYQNFKLNIETGEINNFYNDYIKPKPTIFPLDYFSTKITSYKSRDGKDITITIIHRKNVELTGNNPTLLETYGGYGMVSTPNYTPSLLTFLNNGGVYAYAEVRGGGEKGKKWHKNGCVLTKQNTINDLIDAATFLISEKYTNSNKLAITGGSNGGMVVVAAAMKRPDLFKLVIPIAGVYDMMKFQNFTAGNYWVSEYGSPDKPNEAAYLYSYSPYHNVDTAVNYPIMFFITGNADDRVLPLHSYKMVAVLQNNPSQKNPIYLKMLNNEAHSGNGLFSSKIEREAIIYNVLHYYLME